jgi:hypothetical protein
MRRDRTDDLEAVRVWTSNGDVRPATGVDLVEVASQIRDARAQLMGAR